MQRNTFNAIIWAAAGGLMCVGVFIGLRTNVIFALLFAGMAAAFFLIAASCLLKEPRVEHDRDQDRDHDQDLQPNPERRHRWRPR